jgi:hypothetical protein
MFPITDLQFCIQLHNMSNEAMEQRKQNMEVT